MQNPAVLPKFLKWSPLSIFGIRMWLKSITLAEAQKDVSNYDFPILNASANCKTAIAYIGLLLYLVIT